MLKAIRKEALEQLFFGMLRIQQFHRNLLEWQGPMFKEPCGGGKRILLTYP